MKSRKILSLFIALVFFISENHCFSADEMGANHGETIGLWKKSLVLSSANYSYRDQEGDIGLVGSKIKKIVKDVPGALAEIHSFQDYRISSFVLTLASGTALGFGITDFIDGDNRRGTLFLTAGGSGFVTAIALDRVGYNHLKDGVRKYNDYVRMHSDTSEWTEEAIVYYPGSKSEKVATDMSVYGTFLPITTGAMIWVFLEANTTGEPQTGLPLFFIMTGATVGPALGYLYCQEDLRGFLGVGIRMGLAGLTVFLSEQKDESQPWEKFDLENEYVLGGSLAILLSIAYDISKVDDAVRKYNRKFSEQSFNLVPKYFSHSEALGVEFQLKF